MTMAVGKSNEEDGDGGNSEEEAAAVAVEGGATSDKEEEVRPTKKPKNAPQPIEKPKTAMAMHTDQPETTRQPTKMISSLELTEAKKFMEVYKMPPTARWVYKTINRPIIIDIVGSDKTEIHKVLRAWWHKESPEKKRLYEEKAAALLAACRQGISL